MSSNVIKDCVSATPTPRHKARPWRERGSPWTRLTMHLWPALSLLDPVKVNSKRRPGHWAALQEAL